MFNKRHYEAIGNILGKTYDKLNDPAYKDYSPGEILVDVIVDFEMLFEKDNERFNKEKFEKLVFG